MKSKHLVGLLTSLLWSVLFATAQIPAEFWVIPANDPRFPTSGSGESWDTPMHFSVGQLNTWMSDTGPLDITVNFLPSTKVYEIFQSGQQPRLVIADTRANKRVKLIGKLFDGYDANGGGVGPSRPRPTLKMSNTLIYQGVWGVSGYEDKLLRSGRWVDNTDPNKPNRTSYIDRFAMENLILDGNFPELGVGTSAANATGYKLFALDVWAKKGLFSNLLIKNFGVVGAVPGNAFNAAGTETFPVMFTTFDDGQVPTRNEDGTVTGGDTVPQAAWLVDRVDVSDFHATHGGYATLVMAQVYTLANNLRADLSGSSLLSVAG